MERLTSSLRKGEVYKGFDVVDVVDIPDYSSVGIWVRHRATGMEIFHMQNDDEENLFAFAFGTPPSDSTGVAHILEHSVLCGSRRFPVKDPFIRLANQSVKTFLNAMTFSDKTVYPAASISEKDYFNLMAVYGDAVFFPLLEEWTFAQEGHRLEFDKDGNLSIQGVVFNEMKGNYSSFENIAADWSVRSVLPDTIYDCDSGGDPLEIPRLTYEEFREFHRRHYSPGNCQVFLYGNISTERQLDFIQDNFLSRFDDAPEHVEHCSERGVNMAARIIPSVAREPVAFSAPRSMERPAPASSGNGSGCMVTLTWLLGDSSEPVQYMEAVLLAEILMGHDGAPLMRALLESGLGEDVAPNCGLDGEMNWVLLTAGLRGVRKEDSHKVESVILDVLSKMCEEGVSQDDIQAAILSVDFSQREVHRSHGPYSLVLMRRCLRGWLYGKPPSYTLSNRAAFEQIKHHIESEPGYVLSLLRRMLLENNHRSLVTVYPDDSYSEERQQKEIALAEELLAGTSEHHVRLRQESLTRFQQEPDSQETAALIPHISPSELSVSVDRISTKRCVSENGVPLFLNTEPTNGIVYMDVAFPVDVLDPSYYPLLPLFAVVATNSGFAGKDWAESSARVALSTGGFGARLFTSSMMREDCDVDCKSGADVILGRDWIFFKVKMLSEQVADAIKLLADCLLTVDFSDAKRMEDLTSEFRNDLLASIVPMGNDYVASRASCWSSRSKAVDEIWNGLTQVFSLEKFVGSPSDLAMKFSCILKQLLVSGAIIHVTADEAGHTAVLPEIVQFIRRCGLHAPLPSNVSADTVCFQGMTKMVASENPDESSDNEIFYSNSQVGFAAAAFKSSPYGTAFSVHESVLAHWLSNTALWEQIRTVGGAYGAFVLPDAIERVFIFSTYRDPKPFRSLEVLMECLHSAAEQGIDAEQLERVVTGCYSREVQPRSPSGRGSAGFLRCLYGFSDEQREQKIKDLLASTPKDVKDAACRMLASAMQYTRTAVLCGKNIDKLEKNTGNIISLPV